MTAPRRIAIIGAGPIGLEAGLHAVQAGHDVRIWERGDVANHVRRWGHVKLFSPFGLNASSWGRAALTGAGLRLPADDALLTGHEHAERYLEPLSRLPALADRIHLNTTVRSITRASYLKGEHIGDPRRAADPFRLLLDNETGEMEAWADVVLDCSGTYGRHRWAGRGGAPALGEAHAIPSRFYGVPDVLGSDRESFVDKMTLVIGSGYSAATTVVAIGELAREAPGTSAIWITRRDRTLPIPRIENDALTARDELACAANSLATSKGPVAWVGGRTLHSIRLNYDQTNYVVELQSEDGAPAEPLQVHRVVANVGYRPDRSLYDELQVHECYASQGPMKLAAALMGETSADCLAQSTPGADTLRNPEPNFFILGAKSYGRDSRFLLKIGIEQIEQAFSLIHAG